MLNPFAVSVSIKHNIVSSLLKQTESDLFIHSWLLKDRNCRIPHLSNISTRSFGTTEQKLNSLFPISSVNANSFFDFSTFKNMFKCIYIDKFLIWNKRLINKAEFIFLFFGKGIFQVSYNIGAAETVATIKSDYLDRDAMILSLSMISDKHPSSVSKLVLILFWTRLKLDIMTTLTTFEEDNIHRRPDEVRIRSSKYISNYSSKSTFDYDTRQAYILQSLGEEHKYW